MGEYVIEMCLTSPAYWSLRIVERILKERGGEVGNVAAWEALLAAARDEDGNVDEAMDGDMDIDVGVGEQSRHRGEETRRVTEKLRGPQKQIGLWKRQHIGVILTGWEEDE